MKKQFTLLVLVLLSCAIAAQDENTSIKGFVLNDANDVPIENVHIVNVNQVVGTISQQDGSFSIPAQVNDTLFFSYLGFKSIRVRVTNDWFRFGDIKIKMTEVGFALEEVEIKPVQLTGYLEIDTKIIPIFDDYRYSISGLNIGYEGGRRHRGATSRVLSSIFNPVDLLHNAFGRKPREMRRLRQMKDDENIRNLLQSKFDRETLMVILQLEKAEINDILNNCNYSDTFIRTANDLQILDAMSECYEEFRVLNRGRN